MDQLSVPGRYAVRSLCGLALSVSQVLQAGGPAPAAHELEHDYTRLTFENELLAASAADDLLIEPSRRWPEPVDAPLDLPLDAPEGVPPQPAAATPEPTATLPPAADVSGRFVPRFYAGLGLGISRLEPDTTGVPGVRVTDTSAIGAQFMLGVDFLPFWSVELHATDLGAAQLNQQGEIGYRAYGVSGVLYVGGGHRLSNNRRGLAGFGRLGASDLQTDATSQVRLQQDNEWQVLFGAGLEYSRGRSGPGARVELISFQEDARYAQISVLYRFGGPGHRTRKPVVVSAADPATATAPVSTPAPVAVTTAPLAELPPAAPVSDAAEITQASIATRLPDIDRDGVADGADECPGTLQGEPVNPFGCPLPPGLLEGLQFRSGSTELTDESVNVLVRAAEFLRSWPEGRFRLSAHTDNQGTAENNLALARERAQWVLRFLVSAGISPGQLEARAFGESQPIAPNNTIEGRQANRRIELEVLGEY